MRDTFTDVRDLFNYYYYLKLRHESPRSTFPDREQIGMPRSVNPHHIRSRVEDEKAFIADVGGFLLELRWWERTILLGRLTAPGTPARSYAVIARDIRIRGAEKTRGFPASMAYRENVCTRFKRLLKEAKDYFQRRGYIEDGWKPKEEAA